jgi:hypothetical protein
MKYQYLIILQQRARGTFQKNIADRKFVLGNSKGLWETGGLG